ncbi:hypothetical protein [Acinetobacter sp. MB5]|uniref:hypothetical protein n=1 Tax=Acinetobacter sp. MB5 TaxID=2069438 RepID=UPI000DD041BC|nr:hypothetical protein [Acinetobacter sp. MB5]
MRAIEKYTNKKGVNNSFKPIFQMRTRPSYNEFLLLLRVNSVTVLGTAYPNAQTYIQAFIQAGFTIENLAVLGLSANKLNMPNTARIARVSNPNLVPTNRIATDVRKVWHWV